MFPFYGGKKLRLPEDKARTRQRHSWSTTVTFLFMLSPFHCTAASEPLLSDKADAQESTGWRSWQILDEKRSLLARSVGNCAQGRQQQHQGQQWGRRGQALLHIAKLAGGWLTCTTLAIPHNRTKHLPSTQVSQQPKAGNDKNAVYLVVVRKVGWIHTTNPTQQVASTTCQVQASTRVSLTK